MTQASASHAPQVFCAPEPLCQEITFSKSNFTGRPSGIYPEVAYVGIERTSYSHQVRRRYRCSMPRQSSMESAWFCLQVGGVWTELVMTTGWPSVPHGAMFICFLSDQEKKIRSVWISGTRVEIRKDAGRFKTNSKLFQTINSFADRREKGCIPKRIEVSCQSISIASNIIAPSKIQCEWSAWLSTLSRLWSRRENRASQH